MLLSARNFLNRNSAEHAGANAGQAYAVVIILVLWYLSSSGRLPFCGYTTGGLALLTFLGLRLGCEYYMGQRWDHFQHKRDALQRAGLTVVQAFEKIRDGQ